MQISPIYTHNNQSLLIYIAESFMPQLKNTLLRIDLFDIIQNKQDIDFLPIENNALTFL